METMVKVDIQGALRWLQLDRPQKARSPVLETTMTRPPRPASSCSSMARS